MKILLALLMAASTPAACAQGQSDNGMDCSEYKEVVEVVMEDPYLSKSEKEAISRRVMRNVPHTCIKS
jgi:tellurite resistance protein